MYYKLNPESPAQLGKNTIYDKNSSPWKTTKLHVIFDVWFGGDLLRESPCCYITERFFNKVNLNDFSGIRSISEMEVDKSLTFENYFPNRQPPKCYYLEINGTPGVDDLGLAEKNALVVSQNFLDAMKVIDLSSCTIEEYKIR